MQLKTLKDLYIHEILDLLDAETQLLEKMPELIENTNDGDLKKVMKSHIADIEEQQKTLEEICKALGVSDEEEGCEAMEGLIEEAEELLELNGESNPAVLDAAIIAALQRIEHYEMAAFGAARAFAKCLGNDEDAKKLDAFVTRNQEIDKKLSELAVNKINPKAIKDN